jgi:hypothetical protein
MIQPGQGHFKVQPNEEIGASLKRIPFLKQFVVRTAVTFWTPYFSAYRVNSYLGKMLLAEDTKTPTAQQINLLLEFAEIKGDLKWYMELPSNGKTPGVAG